VYEALVRFKPDMVVHAAGKVGGIQANIREPVRFFLDNLDIGRNVIWAAREVGIKYLLNLGSSCMYPHTAANPLCEENILHGALEPTNEGYALAKISVARLCEYIGREHPEFKYKTLIPCNLFGRFDNFDPQYSHLVPAIIHKLHQGKEACSPVVDIWGDGSVRREFMYAGDLADCIWSSLFNFDSIPTIMNVGLGFDFTVKEYYEKVAQVVGYKGAFEYDFGKPVGMSQKLLNIENAKKWGWKAKHSLEQGLEKTYAYYLRELKC
jgi:GDP-L-fucose synthase